MSKFDFEATGIEVRRKSSFRLDDRPMMCYSPKIFDKVANAYERRDWRELNYLGVKWYDQYAEKWFKFGPTFWDA